MNALIIGYGSIGRRHAEVLSHMNIEISIVSRRNSLQCEYPIYNTINEALEDKVINYIVVANETSSHFSVLEEILNLSFDGKVLIEKPLFLNEEYELQNVGQVYVAYNLRYHPLIDRLKDLIEDEKVIAVNTYVGQYLPSWRPQTDYTKSYSAFANKGGGVLRDLSHELDYLTMLFGEWYMLTSTVEKISSLHIKSEDYVKLLYRTKNCNIQVSVELNYLDRIIQRYMIIQTNNKTIKVDFIGNVINCNGDIEVIQPINRNYTYEKQHKDVLNGAVSCCSFEEGHKIVKMINKIEQASELKEWVYND